MGDDNVDPTLDNGNGRGNYGEVADQCEHLLGIDPCKLDQYVITQLVNPSNHWQPGMAAGAVLDTNVDDMLLTSDSTASTNAMVPGIFSVIHPTYSTAFNGVLTTFIDANFQNSNGFNLTSTYTVMIDWGDGSAPTAGTVGQDLSGELDVYGTHTYNNAGDYLVNMTITNEADVTINASAAAIAANIMPTIEWQNPADIVYGTPISGTQLDATASNPATGYNVPGQFTYTVAPGTVPNAGINQEIDVTFTPTNTNNYDTATSSTHLNVNPAPLTVTLHDATKVYGQDNPTFTYSIAGLVNGDQSPIGIQISPITLATNASSVGTYVISALIPRDGSSNYDITAVNHGVLTITPAPLTITATARKVYGAALPTYTASYTGFVNGDTAANLTTQPRFGTLATAASPVTGNPYAITVAAAADNNYTITYTPGNLTVIPAKLTIVANNAIKMQGQANSPLTGTITGLVNGGQLTATYSTDATTASAQGVYAITPTANAGPNYTVTFVTGTLIVTATPNQVVVAETYETFLHRPADAAGMAYWSGLLNSSSNPTVDLNYIATSTESDTDIVTADYEKFLNRAPDPAGFSAWVSQLQHGMRPDMVAVYILTSSEFFAKAGSTKQGFVDALYYDVLGRTPDPAGAAYWTSAMAHGVSRAKVAFDFVLSHEAATDAVLGDYEQILRRVPGTTELNYWAPALTNRLLTNQQEAVDFLISQENMGRIQSAIAANPLDTPDQLSMGLL